MKENVELESRSSSLIVSNYQCRVCGNVIAGARLPKGQEGDYYMEYDGFHRIGYFRCGVCDGNRTFVSLESNYG